MQCIPGMELNVCFPEVRFSTADKSLVMGQLLWLLWGKKESRLRSQLGGPSPNQNGPLVRRKSQIGDAESGADIWIHVREQYLVLNINKSEEDS